MKKNIHPDYHRIQIQLTNGEIYESRSTWGKEGEILKLDIDPSGHSAWTKGRRKLVESGRLARFHRRFENFGLKN